MRRSWSEFSCRSNRLNHPLRDRIAEWALDCPLRRPLRLNSEATSPAQAKFTKERGLRYGHPSSWHNPLGETPRRRLAPVSDRRNILVVDDDEINRMVVRVLMERRNYRVVEAASGPEALDLVKEEAFDVVLMDLSMPGMDGLETTRHIRSDAAGSQLPVVALTAHTSHQEQQMCLEAGMNAVLRKPFDSEQVDRLLGLLDHSAKGPDA